MTNKEKLALAMIEAATTKLEYAELLRLEAERQLDEAREAWAEATKGEKT